MIKIIKIIFKVIIFIITLLIKVACVSLILYAGFLLIIVTLLLWDKTFSDKWEKSIRELLDHIFPKKQNNNNK